MGLAYPKEISASPYIACNVKFTVRHTVSLMAVLALPGKLPGPVLSERSALETGYRSVQLVKAGARRVFRSRNSVTLT